MNQAQTYTPEDLLLAYIFPDFKPDAESRAAKRGAEKTARRFIITEAYSGKRGLSDIFVDLLYSEYCRKEQQKNNLQDA